MNRLPIPIIGAGLIITFLVTLVLLVTLRPWAGKDESANTLLNYSEEIPEGYTRTPLGLLGADDETPSPWHPPFDTADIAPADGRLLFTGYGCASCHGLDAQGGAVGLPLEELSSSDVKKSLKKGPEGMPSFDSLSAKEIDTLLAFVTGQDHASQPAATIEVIEPSIGTGPVSEVSAPPPTLTTETSASVDPVVAQVEPALSLEANAEPVVAPTAVPLKTFASIDGQAPALLLSGEPGLEPSATPEPLPVPTPEPVIEPAKSGPPVVLAVFGAKTVDGDTADWSDIEEVSIPMQQIKPIPGVDMGALPSIDMGVKAAVDAERIYVLLEVNDDFDYVPDDHGLSAAVAIMFRIDEKAAPHMGSTEDNQRKSLGKVDIWHWELDCGPGEMSGGVTGIRGGNDPNCNLDDEWAKRPEDLEDDGSSSAENSLAGVWEHTARSNGQGAEGTWIFEMSRPLQTADPDDAQFESGGTLQVALAYWDADETPDGWTSEGHLQSSTGGWIQFQLP